MRLSSLPINKLAKDLFETFFLFRTSFRLSLRDSACIGAGCLTVEPKPSIDYRLPEMKACLYGDYRSMAPIAPLLKKFVETSHNLESTSAPLPQKPSVEADGGLVSERKDHNRKRRIFTPPAFQRHPQEAFQIHK